MAKGNAAFAAVRLRMVEDIRAGEIDVRPGKMDFHIHVVRRGARINVQQGFVVRVVNEPADAICGHSVRLGNQSLHIGRAGDGREVDMIRVMSEIGDRIEMPGARLRICHRLEYEGVIAGASGAAYKDVVRHAAYKSIGVWRPNQDLLGRRVSDQRATGSVARQEKVRRCVIAVAESYTIDCSGGAV